MASEWVPIRRFARHNGISVVTARRWADDGLVEVKYTVGGHRRFSIADASRPERRASIQPPPFGGAVRAMGAAGEISVFSQGRARWVDGSRDAHTMMLKRLDEFHSSGVPVTIARLDENGHHDLVTIAGWLFSVQWVKQNYGGGRFLANDVEFLIAGPSKPRY
jgi:hypothetical protein